MFLPIVKFFTTEQGEVLEFVSRQLAFPEVVPNDSRLDSEIICRFLSGKEILGRRSVQFPNHDVL